MDGIGSSFACRVDGLEKIYVCQEKPEQSPSAYFVFKSSEKVEAAAEGIKFQVEITNMVLAHNSLFARSNDRKQADEKGALDLLRSNLVPEGENPSLTCGYSAKSTGTVGTPITSYQILIQHITNTMTLLSRTEEEIKVPVVHIKLDKLYYPH